jgi:hypothetical protein
MDLFVLMAQRKERYEGEYGLEALAVMSEADDEGNPDYLRDKLKEHKSGTEFEAVAIIRLTVSEAAIHAVLFPESRAIEATVHP